MSSACSTLPGRGSGLSPEIPVHLFAGIEDGPTFLVQATIHGNESVGNLALLRWVQHLDPKTLRGNVIAVPTVNRVGLELLERGSRIHGNTSTGCFLATQRLRFRSDRSCVLRQVIRQADVMIDFHAGGRTAYERYVLFNAEETRPTPTEQMRRRRLSSSPLGWTRGLLARPARSERMRPKKPMDAPACCSVYRSSRRWTGWFKNGLDNVRVTSSGASGIRSKHCAW